VCADRGTLGLLVPQHVQAALAALLDEMPHRWARQVEAILAPCHQDEWVRADNPEPPEERP
jgi:hypothetical protein